MSTLFKTHPDHREAVRRLVVREAPRSRIRRRHEVAPHDVRREAVGGFAGPVAPDAPVGTFANVSRMRRRGNGAFAGDPDRQRQGSFGDIDRGTAA